MKKPVMALWTTAIQIMTLGAIMNSCAFGGGASWKEEALLQDGRKIILVRSQTRGGRHEIGQDTPVDRHIITFVLPDTKKTITWESQFGLEPGQSSLIPLALDMVGGVPYLVATTAGCIAYNKWGRPNPPYVVFRFDGVVWQRILLANLPMEIKEANMVIGAFTLRDEARLKKYSGPIPAREIRKLNAEALNPNVLYLRVFAREPVRVSVTVDCPDLNSPRYTSPKAPLPIIPPSSETKNTGK